MVIFLREKKIQLKLSWKLIVTLFFCCKCESLYNKGSMILFCLNELWMRGAGTVNLECGDGKLPTAQPQLPTDTNRKFITLPSCFICNK